MKANKIIALAMFAAATLAIAGPVCAGSGKGAAVHASSVRPAGNVASPNASVAGPAGVGRMAALRANNRRFFRRNFSPFPYYGYGYGNQVYLNPDEADWAEQWKSLSEDNDGPYARSTFEGNPQGPARMWEFPDDGAAAKPATKP